MKTPRPFLLIVLALLMLLCSSCHSPDQNTPDGEETGTPVMAQHFSRASMACGELFMRPQHHTVGSIFGVLACDTAAEEFDPYYPCYVPGCGHNTDGCCAFVGYSFPNHTLFLAYEEDGEPTVLMCSRRGDLYISKPLSNKKTKLSDRGYTSSDKSNLFVYGDWLYFTQLMGSGYIQYRALLEDGTVERVFEQDNVIIKTIINDRYYGMIYGTNPMDNIGSSSSDVTYFRSDMNYENIEALPDILLNFSLPEDKSYFKFTAILDADEQNIYVLHDKKIWALSDADINAEPRLISTIDLGPIDDGSKNTDTAWYRDGTLYYLFRNGDYNIRDVYSMSGEPTQTAWWYHKCSLYAIDIMTGEVKSWDISSDTAQFHTIYYVVNDRVCGDGSYIREDGYYEFQTILYLDLNTMTYGVKLDEELPPFTPQTPAN